MKKGRRLVSVVLAMVFTGVVVPGTLGLLPFSGLSLYRTLQTQETVSLWEGTQGQEVRTIQTKLKNWGYYNGPIDGYYGASTTQAVIYFQRQNGLRADGVVGPQTRTALGLATGTTTTTPVSTPAGSRVSLNRSEDLDLLARTIAAEAQGEPFTGQVAVAAVILNRVRHPSFPNTLSGVIYQPHAFESVSNGLIWRRSPDQSAVDAARQALNGWDPTYGCLFFWNPYKPVSAWIWSRQIITQIGNHVFAL